MLETTRLILMQWEAKNMAPFAAKNADPDVMRFFPVQLLREESESLTASSEMELMNEIEVESYASLESRS